MAPSTNYSYGEHQYWNDRYSKEGPDVVFDWYQRYDALAPFFRHYLKKPSKILVLGCGNSALSADMAADGYENIWSIDISEVVISGMKAKHAHVEQLKYIVMDARRLEFDSGSFDAVLDKGTLDAIMCGNNSVENVRQLLNEAARVLKPGGIYMLITYGEPRTRMCYLESRTLPWSVQLHIIPRPGEEVPLCEGRPIEDNPQFLLKPVQVHGNKLEPSGISLESANVHFIYVCTERAAADGAEASQSLLTEGLAKLAFDSACDEDWQHVPFNSDTADLTGHC